MKTTALFCGAVVCVLAVAGAAWLIFQQRLVEQDLASVPVALSNSKRVAVSDIPDEVARARVVPPAAPVQQTEPDPPGLVIAGQAVTAGGEPAAGAAIAAYTADTGAVKVAAGDDGRFRVVGLRSGAYRVSANLEHYNEAVQEEVTAGSSGVQLVLEPLSAVEGRVLRAEGGEPLEKFDVLYLKAPPGDDAYWQNVIHGENTQWTPVGNVAGRYRIEDIASGAEFAVGVRAEGYEPAYAVVPAAKAGQTASAPDLLLQAEARVEGRVLSSSRAPLAGATIYFGEKARGRHVAMSNPDGTYAIGQLPAGPLTLSATHTNHLPGTAQTTAVRGQTVVLDIVLGGGGSVQGRLLNGAIPLAEQTVSASRLVEPRVRKQATTDAMGAYLIEGLPAGEVEIIAKVLLDDDRDAVPVRVQRTAVIEEGQATTVDFQFGDATSAIEGLITVAGQPPSLVLLQGYVSGESGDSFFNASAKSDGTYLIQNLPPGSAWLEVTITMEDGRERRKNIPVEVPPNQTVRQDIALDGAAVVSGTVANLGDTEGGEVMVVPGENQFDPAQSDLVELERMVSASCPIASDGSFKVTGLDAGVYTLIVVAFDPDAVGATGDLPPIRFKTERIMLSPGQQLVLDLVLS